MFPAVGAVEIKILVYESLAKESRRRMPYLREVKSEQTRDRPDTQAPPFAEGFYQRDVADLVLEADQLWDAGD